MRSTRDGDRGGHAPDSRDDDDDDDSHSGLSDNDSADMDPSSRGVGRRTVRAPRVAGVVGVKDEAVAVAAQSIDEKESAPAVGDNTGEAGMCASFRGDRYGLEGLEDRRIGGSDNK